MIDTRMGFQFTPADETTVRAFLAWQYDSPYDIYNVNAGEVEASVSYYLEPQVCCYAITDHLGDLVAYCTFGLDAQVPGGDYAEEALDIGLGVRPDLTGQGRGTTFVDAVLVFAATVFQPMAFRVTVAEFNKRALRVWEQVGFRRVQRFERTPDPMPFVILLRDV